MSYNENHNTRMEEARQPSEEDVPMLAIGHSSLWSNDRDMSAISEGSLELELDQDDTLPPGTSSTDHCARDNEAQSPSNKYAKLDDGAASVKSGDQDRFLARVKATEPRR